MILDQLPAVKALAPEEMWELLDELWKELARAAEGAPPDPATIALLQRRDAEYQADREAVRPWSEVQARLAAHKQARRASE